MSTLWSFYCTLLLLSIPISYQHDQGQFNLPDNLYLTPWESPIQRQLAKKVPAAGPTEHTQSSPARTIIQKKGTNHIDSKNKKTRSTTPSQEINRKQPRKTGKNIPGTVNRITSYAYHVQQRGHRDTEEEEERN